MTDNQDTGLTELTDEQHDELELLGIGSDAVIAVLDGYYELQARNADLRKERDEARAEVERLQSTFFSNKLYLTIVSHPALNNETGEALYDRVLALIRNETGGDR